MRFKQNEPKRKYRIGDIKKVKKFAWLPTLIEKENQYIWLEFYYVRQEFIEEYYISEWEEGRRQVWEILYKETI